ncbi:flagellar basal body-associated FliL family protein [Variovorax sp. J22R115]|uniref:flagellar basal body-associated FliL family protein n=1 Tax=Variovorax sp. J22R115 TaxID=3053509 RepID=UPI002574B99D|nr:flagellar basal body-associated FliL family protein [Variovorax sp. J22R115]MDM0052403.1 flagellar basal body-associated FliL family protein [Variovorax sp. J22R115]
MASSPPVANVANVANGANAPAPRSSKLLIGLMVGISLIASVAVGYFFVIGPKATAATEIAKPAAPEKPIFVTLEPLTVNLQSEGRGKFLHIGMSLKVRDEPAKAQIVEFMPELRSRALLLLSNRLPESLMSTEDKSKLAEEIRTELNRPLADNLPPQGIASVSFNTFVVQ